MLGRSITGAAIALHLIVLGCVLLSFFFAGSETALTASSRARMSERPQLSRKGPPESALLSMWPTT